MKMKNYYWSRAPGVFLDVRTGIEIKDTNGESLPFCGTVREWYGTFLPVIEKAFEELYQKHLQTPQYLEVASDVLALLEHLECYRSNDPTIPKKLPISGGEYVGVLNGNLKVIKCKAIQSNVARIVLVGNLQIKSSTSSDSTTPKLNFKHLGSFQKLGSCSIYILNMGIL